MKKITGTPDKKMEQFESVVQKDNQMMNDALKATRNTFCELLGIPEVTSEHEQLYKWYLIETFDKNVRLRTQRKEIKP